METKLPEFAVVTLAKLKCKWNWHNHRTTSHHSPTQANPHITQIARKLRRLLFIYCFKELGVSSWPIVLFACAQTLNAFYLGH